MPFLLAGESSRGSSFDSFAGSSSAETPRETGSDQTFQWTSNKCRNVKIVSLISHFILIFILILFICLFCYQGRSVPSNHQKDEIKYPPLTCPPDWIGHQRQCYKLSREEKNWEDSQNFCILHNASLAKITDEEMDFVTMLTRNHVFWIGLKREPDQSWKWLDGANATLKVRGKGKTVRFCTMMPQPALGDVAMNTATFAKKMFLRDPEKE